MPSCDICSKPPGSDAKRYTAAQLRRAVDTGYRPTAVIEHYRTLAATFQLDLGDEHWFGEWVAQVRQDRTDWLLCRACSTGLEKHLQQAGGAHAQPPAPPRQPPRRRRGLFGWRR